MSRPQLKPGYVCRIARKCRIRSNRNNLYVVLAVDGDGVSRYSVISTVQIFKLGSFTKCRKRRLERRALWYTGHNVDHTIYLKERCRSTTPTGKAKAKVSQTCIGSVRHPEYVSRLARRTFLADLEKDLLRQFQRTQLTWPVCKKCGTSKEFTVVHSNIQSDAYLKNKCDCR